MLVQCFTAGGSSCANMDELYDINASLKTLNYAKLCKVKENMT